MLSIILSKSDNSNPDERGIASKKLKQQLAPIINQEKYKLLTTKAKKVSPYYKMLTTELERCNSQDPSDLSQKDRLSPKNVKLALLLQGRKSSDTPKLPCAPRGSRFFQENKTPSDAQRVCSFKQDNQTAASSVSMVSP
jgi:hypothetical protein